MRASAVNCSIVNEYTATILLSFGEISVQVRPSVIKSCSRFPESVPSVDDGENAFDEIRNSPVASSGTM